MRAQDKCVHRWKADRQVGHPVILAGPAKMIGRTFYSTTSSTDDKSFYFIIVYNNQCHFIYIVISQYTLMMTFFNGFFVKALKIFIDIGMLRAFHGI